ncbi:MAG: 2-amino-4-hydroxy-6-hydroxymethyldihydropteridine diphosphokinase [Venatoribacter sp.]
MAICYIGIGANLNNPVEQIHTALQALAQLPQSRLLRSSSLYGSKPQGPQDQPDYVNAVAELETELSPLELLNALQAQEQAQGRVKLRRWGERSIDLDILLYDQLMFSSERLTVPHIQLKNRSFVVEPLLELSPSLVLPSGELLAEVEPEFTGDLIKLPTV